jgi:hypothetical protein
LLLVAATAMLIPAAAAGSGKLIPLGVLAITALRFATTGLYELTASPTWEDIAGVTGLVLCGLALYAALAMALEDARRETSLPVLRRGLGRTSLEETSTTSWPVSNEKPAYASSYSTPSSESLRHENRGYGRGMRLGFFLSCEEYGPEELVAQARAAEQAGFHGLWISDHYHPWNHEQGQSPFVWSVIGALTGAGVGLPVTTAVTCPTVRVHPAVIAQAAATSQVLLDGRFTLGVGSGEALNEHILGDRWPEADMRLEMLEEAVEIIRALWGGDSVSHRGTHYTVENARIFTVPDAPPPIFVSGFG